MTPEEPAPRASRRYLREPVPLHFPSAELMPESALQLRLRTALFLLLDRRLGASAYVGSDQFVYWDPTDPTACVAPDAFVRLGGPRELLPSYKTWEHGAPQVAVEIVSAFDVPERAALRKIERYRRCGVPELVRFDPAHAERPLEIWDLVDGDYVERDRALPEWNRCAALGAYFHVHTDERLGIMLRVSEHADGSGLWPTAEEAEIAEREAREAERQAREAEQQAREAEHAAAQRRIAELEAELRKRG